MADTDPFDCFGSDDDGDEASLSSIKNDDHDHDNGDDNRTAALNKAQQPQLRDPDCGVCRQLHAEKSLLMHVKNTFGIEENNDVHKQGDNVNDNDDSDDILARCENVKNIVDEFCERRAWMMHIGPEKGLIIQNALKKKLDDFVELNKSKIDGGSNSGSDTKRPHFVCVELGTYCGYGSIWLAKTLYEYAKNYVDIDFHLFTVEINPPFAKIAQDLINLCKLNNYVTILENDLLMSGETGHVGLLLKDGILKQRGLKHDEDICIDFLLIDHDKDSYLDDLKRLEGCGMIKEGTVVAADNVVFAKIDNYVSYMKKLDEEGVVSTKTIESFVEYSSPDISNNVGKAAEFCDGIGTFIKMLLRSN
jgi:catechol O-methyltransferase